MSSLTARAPMLAISAKRPQDTEAGCAGRIQFIRCRLEGAIQSQRFPTRKTNNHAHHIQARNVRCSAEGQTQTVTREQSTISLAPVQGKEKSPEIDDGGDGFPPRDDGDGGGGGGGGGGGWAGGFFFFGFLALLSFMKDKESEGPYGDERRR